jgi:small subunit ribosomal protein S17
MVNMNKNDNKKRKTLSGTIVSNKMKDTAVVLVERYIKHRKLGKYYKVRKKHKAHNLGNKHQEGEKVTIEECQPISRDKHFKILEQS